jgi:hypothetical protein
MCRSMQPSLTLRSECHWFVSRADRRDAVAGYGDSLANHYDEELDCGALLDWQLEPGMVGIGDFGAGADYAGISGVGQGAANLQVLRRLADGLQQLRG